MKIDKGKYEKILFNNSYDIIKKFMEKYPEDKLTAIGYVFELWNSVPQFNLCANTKKYFVLKMKGEKDINNIRWNSWNYEFPAGILWVNEFWEKWNLFYNQTHNFILSSKNDFQLLHDNFQYVYDNLIEICTLVFIKLLKSDLFINPLLLDYNISEYSDDISLVIDRNNYIKNIAIK